MDYDRILLSRPVHYFEAVSSLDQCLGRRQIFAGPLGCRPGANLLDPEYSCNLVCNFQQRIIASGQFLTFQNIGDNLFSGGA